MKRILVTGGAGFIGTNFIKMCERNGFLDNHFLHIYDNVTYAANTKVLRNIQNHDAGYSLFKGNINDKITLDMLFKTFKFQHVINFAAESHVDNSISDPTEFVKTNVLGTQVLMDVARHHWKGDNKRHKFIHISTDEVYGSLGKSEPQSTEGSLIKPNSPYAASKASSDLLVRSYVKTYKFPAIITRCSNNYGKYQHKEKLIPKMIMNAVHDSALPVYGNGKNIRDWIHVDDHCRAILKVLESGKVGEVYNIGANNEMTNLKIINFILDYLEKPKSLIKFVDDRLGHDKRYGIDSSKIRNDLGWEPTEDFEDSMIDTIEYYKSIYGI